MQAYEIVRQASGIGAGNGPIISFHDAFLTQGDWAGFLPGADRIALDDHPYLAFGTQSTSPISTYATTPCSTWGGGVNVSMGAFGLTGAGEFSNAVTDCGLWVNGVGQGIRYEGTYVADPSFQSVGSCTPWTDWQAWDQPTKQATMQFALASMDALQVYISCSCLFTLSLSLSSYRTISSGHGRWHHLRLLVLLRLLPGHTN